MDPRGDKEGSSIYYDLGKIWHSVNGLYDFLHTDQFEIDYKFKNKEILVDLNFNNHKALAIYNKIKISLPKLLMQFPQIKDDKYWMQKILFSEMCHFASVMPFHLKSKGNNDKAIAMYIIGVKLFNEFVDSIQMYKFKDRGDYVNINTLSDYKNAVKKLKNTKDDLFDFYGTEILDKI